MWCFDEKLAQEVVEKMGDQSMKSIFIDRLESSSTKAVSDLVNFVFSMNVAKSGIQSLTLRRFPQDILLQDLSLERVASICRFIKTLNISWMYEVNDKARSALVALAVKIMQLSFETIQELRLEVLTRNEEEIAQVVEEFAGSQVTKLQTLDLH